MSSSSDSDGDAFTFCRKSFRSNRNRQRSDSSSSDSSESGDAREIEQLETSADEKGEIEHGGKAAPGAAADVLDVESSSDEDVDVRNVDAESAMTLKRAQEARETLRKSQKACYEVDDDDAMTEKSLEVMEDVGEEMTLRVRNKEGMTRTMKGGTREKIEYLVERYRDLIGVESVELFFDGVQLDGTRTLESYDVEDEDLIDARHSNAKEERINIITRDGNSKRRWNLKRDDPFQKLVDHIMSEKDVLDVSILYNNKILNLATTPNVEGMIGEATLDIRYVLKSKLVLKFRINGTESHVLDITIGEKDPLQKAVDQFCVTKKCSQTEAIFLLDGEPLSMKATPEGEDLEGGEIIDVVWKQKTKNETRGRPITVQTIRNKATHQPKKFRLNQFDTVVKLKRGYMEYYKNKGCKTVKFYFDNKHVSDENATLASLGVGEMGTFHAVENGQSF